MFLLFSLFIIGVFSSMNYEHFLAVQKIYNIVDELIDESMHYGMTWIMRGRIDFPFPSAAPDHDKTRQTRQGLYLEEYEYLLTPWGRIRLTGGCAGNYYGRIAYKKSLWERFSSRLHRVKMQHGVRNEKYHILRSASTNMSFVATEVLRIGESDELFEECFKTVVGRTEISKRKGEDVFVVNSESGTGPIYELLSLDGVPLPQPKGFKEYDERRSKQEVESSWNAFLERYNRERDSDEL